MLIKDMRSIGAKASWDAEESTTFHWAGLKFFFSGLVVRATVHRAVVICPISHTLHALSDFVFIKTLRERLCHCYSVSEETEACGV